MVCRCFIIPAAVLERFSRDETLEPAHRRRLAFDATLTRSAQTQRATQADQTRLAHTQGMAPPPNTTAPVFALDDCNHAMNLPGVPVGDPQAGGDGSARDAAAQARAVNEFYSTVFARNSIDGAGMTITSSVHYGSLYNNAFWNGTQMVYGDGDGNLLIDFTKGDDVIAHELTHGVTQHSLQLAYVNEAGGLNESFSDVFGSMFRQWVAGQDVDQADWMIGKDIMGPAAIARGFSCLRDLSSPGAAHCMAAQPFQYSDYHDGMDPHMSSGIANLAFYTAARAIGGKSWEKIGQIWYAVLTGAPSAPNMTMAAFANLTRQRGAEAGVASAIDSGWKTVGL